MNGVLAMPSCKSDKNWEKEYNIERDFEAVCRAKAVEKDPERMKNVKAYAKKKLEENKSRRDEMQAMIDVGEGKNP
jgi:hypothetical protein